MVTKAIITTLDNLPILKEQLSILRDEPIDEIVVVNNGSRDGTAEWLAAQDGIVVVNRDNLGAGPGRNAGLDAAGEFDYVLMLDGGIRPLRGGTRRMLEYLEGHPEVDIISPEIFSCFTTDENVAWRRMPEPIDKSTCFQQRCLSSTAYALCRARAWEGLRFSEEGPFGEPGWGVDDNEMQCRWNHAGIVHHDFGGVKVYRRASGSHQRIFQETGIGANQYGSVYEKRLVKLWQDWMQYFDKWGASRIDVSCVILGWNEYPIFARAIKRLHEDLRDIPHEIIFVNNGSTDETSWWLDTFALRQPHGDVTIDAVTGEILRKKDRPDLEPVWTGDVIRVDLPENMGTGTGYNEGFAKARGRYIFYLSGDILPVMGTISALKEYLDIHDNVDRIGINPWVNQDKDEDPPFTGFQGLAKQGMGNFAGSYAMMRRKIIDAGCRMADTGPFAGAGCGYEEAEFASQIYERGFRCYWFNSPGYYHRRRDSRRSGHPEGKKEQNLEERRRWLRTRWPEQEFDIVHYHKQPAPRHVRRVAVIHKGSPDRPGIGGNLAAALGAICEAQLFKPGDEPDGWDDYFYVDNGDHDQFLCPEHCHPSIFWAIDMMTPQQSWRPSLEGYVQRARTFDRIFAAQPSAVDYFRENDIEVTWLPLAANPDYHKPWDEEIIYDWIALWHNVAERIEYTAPLREAFPNGFVGYKDGKAYAEWMSKARCAVSLSRSDELTLRVFEVMAMGVPLVTDRVRDLDTIFVEEEHYLGYSSPEELVERVRWVQEHPEEVRAMAGRAREEVLGKHTFYHRVLQIWGG